MKKHSKLVTYTVAAMSLFTAMSGSSLSLSLPHIATSFHIPASTSSIVMMIGMITEIILMVAFGHLGDLFSKNTVYIFGGWIYAFGSLLSGLVPSFSLLLASIFVQGLGSAMVLATTLGLLKDDTTDDDYPQALATNSMSASIGALLGPVIGGVILSAFVSSGWRWIFLLSAPVAAIIMLVSGRAIRRESVDKSQLTKTLKTANWSGQIIFTVGILLMFGYYVFIVPRFNAFENYLTFIILGGIIVVSSFIQDDKAKSPWISPKVLRDKVFLTSNSLLFLSQFGYALSNILLPFYLQNFLAYSAGLSGLIIAVNSLVTFLLSPLIGKWAGKSSRRWLLMVLGLVMIAISQAGYAAYLPTKNLAIIFLPIIINGIGWAFFLSPNAAITMSHITSENSGVAGSVNQTLKTLGMAVGVGFTTSLLTVLTKNATIVPGNGKVTPFLSAFHFIFWIGTAIAVFTIILSLFQKKDDEAAEAPVPAVASNTSAAINSAGTSVAHQK